MYTSLILDPSLYVWNWIAQHFSEFTYLTHERQALAFSPFPVPPSCPSFPLFPVPERQFTTC